MERFIQGQITRGKVLLVGRFLLSGFLLQRLHVRRNDTPQLLAKGPHIVSYIVEWFLLSKADLQTPKLDYGAVRGFEPSLPARAASARVSFLNFLIGFV